jgi:hypothetical protein
VRRAGILGFCGIAGCSILGILGIAGPVRLCAFNGCIPLSGFNAIFAAARKLFAFGLLPAALSFFEAIRNRSCAVCGIGGSPRRVDPP